MLDQLIDIVLQAGAIACRRAGGLRDTEVSHKSAVDMVTEVDTEIETFLKTRLADPFPRVEFYGEEGEYGDLDDLDRVFIVDPLDGTTSYIHGHPFYSVSLAYREDGITRLGVVHLPAFQETYWAVRGEGAFHEGRPISVSHTDALINCLGATGFACVRARQTPDGLPLFNDVIYRLRGIRRCGSAAIDLCYVAQGRYDLYWELNLQPWDTAAGVLIVREAGGVVTDLDGAHGWESKRHLLATNGRVHKAFLEVAASQPH